MAQAAHGSAPDIAGKGIANPVGMIISAAMLLQWLGERNDSLSLRQAAMRIDGAVDLVLASGFRRMISVAKSEQPSSRKQC